MNPKLIGRSRLNEVTDYQNSLNAIQKKSFATAVREWEIFAPPHREAGNREPQKLRVKKKPSQKIFHTDVSG